MSNRTQYENDLAALKTALTEMGQSAADAVEAAMEALCTADAGAAAAVAQGDGRINNMERDIEHRCMTLLLRQQPVAGDLRRISTTMKVVTDVERIGDHASDIAEIIPHLVTVRKEGDPAVSQAIKMGQKAHKMILDALNALTAEDEQAALKVIAADDEVDYDFNAIKHTLAQEIAADPGKVDAAMDALDVPTALIAIFEVVQRANKYIDETAPWVLAKSEETKPRLEAVLYNLCDALRTVTVLMQAYLPNTAPKMAEQLGLSDLSYADLANHPAEYHVHKGEALFPRIDVKREIEYLEAEDAKQKAAAEAAAAPKAEEKKEEAVAEITDHEPEISFDDFCKVELRVAEVRACENMKESKKLLHLTVFDGERERCILSGIAKWYKPEDLIGKKIAIVANLAPRPMMKGKYTSEGMIVAADTADGGCEIAFYSNNVPTGTRVH